MNYDDYDGLGLAQLVREKKASPDELLEEAIRRLERLNPDLNVVITPMYDSARKQCRKDPVEGPFTGVPFLAKDLMLFFAGERLTNGSRALVDYRPSHNCGQAQAIRDAGFITFGKTNCSELGAQPLTNPAAFGPTRNPWDLSRNSGGSSGGSSAAVAARIVPLAASSDGGGSIRLPASYCGVFGFKPSRGLNPFESVSAWGGAVVTNATTLTVRDSAAYLDWTSRRIDGGQDKPPEGFLLAQTKKPPKKLRVAVSWESPVGGGVHPECVKATQGTARLLEGLGHRVEAVNPPYDGPGVMRALLTVVAVYTRHDLERMAKWVSRPWRRLSVEAPTRFLAEVSAGITEKQLEEALATWRTAAHQMERFHQDYDVLLTPVVATLPLRHDELSATLPERFAMRLLSLFRAGRFLYGDALLEQAINKGIAPLPFLPIANVTGQPAMSVPLHWTKDGLPVGSHFMSARGQDGRLLSLAAQLEKARPWRDRRPSPKSKGPLDQGWPEGIKPLI